MFALSMLKTMIPEAKAPISREPFQREINTCYMLSKGAVWHIKLLSFKVKVFVFMIWICP